MKTNIIITGTSTYDNYTELAQVCSDYVTHLIKDCVSKKEEISVLTGMAPGAENLGTLFAKECGLYRVIFAGDWQNDAATTVSIRNQQMVKFAVAGGGYGVLLAFWDGICPSTKNMIALGEKHKMKIFITLTS